MPRSVEEAVSFCFIMKDDLINDAAASINISLIFKNEFERIELFRFVFYFLVPTLVNQSFEVALIRQIAFSAEL